MADEPSRGGPDESSTTVADDASAGGATDGSMDGADERSIAGGSTDDAGVDGGPTDVATDGSRGRSGAEAPVARVEAIRAVDPPVAALVDAERRRQRSTLSLIASENHASRAVCAAQGSTFTNKYAEGTPGDRLYAGCEHVDDLEELARDRARELWGAEHANVQPHSGTNANLAAYAALLEPGDRICSLELADGGHLSHGQPGSLVREVYDVTQYGVDPATGRLDYEAVRERLRAADADLLVAGYSAYPRIVDWERMRAIADETDAYLVADVAHLTGLVAAGVHPSPVGIADVVTGSTHKTIRAGRGGIVMCDEPHADAVDAAVMPGTQGGPLVHNVAGKAVGFAEALSDEFDAYAEQTVANARALAGRLADHGLTIVSGGTDVHFALVDLRDSHPDLTGQAAEDALAEAGLIANKSAVPGDQRHPTVASGLRIGTPAVTTRGFDEAAARRLADLIARVVDGHDDDTALQAVRESVDALCAEYPVYEG